ncbi:MAG TPA: TM2 domain-containing protein [Kocuria rosea]|nr:TM2 domain-containing protein [Kocuria rosea]
MAPEPEYYRPVPLQGDPARAGHSGAPYGFPPGRGGYGPPVPPQPVVNLVGGKSVLLAYVLWFLLGWLGAHKFYLRQPIWGLVYLVLGGLGWSLAGIGVGFLFLVPWSLLMLVDVITMPFRTALVNASIARSAYRY